MKNLIIFILFCGLSLVTQAADSDAKKSPTKTKSVEQRLQELEAQQAEFGSWYSEFYLQSKNRVSPFLGEKLLLGGFFESAITHISGPDTPTQTSANTNILGVNIAADFNEEFRFVVQYLTGLSYTFQNPHNNPALTPSQRAYNTPSLGAIVAHAYAEYRKSDAFILQSGLGYVPFGHSFQQREPVLFKRRNGPQMVSTSDANSVGIAFPLWMGLHLEGSFSVERGRIGYDLYTISPSTYSKNLGVGGRTWWSDSQKITAGLSLQSGEQASGSYYSYGADVNVKFNSFGFVTEYGQNVAAGSTPNMISYYFEPYYILAEGKWLVYAAADYLDNPTHAVGAVSDPYKKWLYGVGVNWLPVSNARFRLGVLSHDYIGDSESISGQKRDYYSVDFSTGVAF